MYSVKLEPDYIESVEQQYKLAQDVAKQHMNTKFVCPYCNITRIPKARMGAGEWTHTGCVCTLEHLKVVGTYRDTSE